jgi:hypothetical protein
VEKICAVLSRAPLRDDLACHLRLQAEKFSAEILCVVCVARR